MKVTFSATHSVFAVKAPKDTLVSLSDTPTQVEDGVYKIGDNGVVLIDEQYQTDSIYLSTAGNDYTVAKGERIATVAEGVEVWAGSSGISCPFAKGGKGGGGSSGGCNYKGTTTTAISNGSTTNPITIDGESYTAVFGDIVVYGYTEFVFDGTTWSEFGRPFDTTPTSGSANAVMSSGVYELIHKGTGINSAVMLPTSVANAQYSVAIGHGLVSNNSFMVSVGKFNASRTNDIFEVGNGNNNAARSNILEANATSVNINGDIKRNGVGIDDYTTTERKIGKWIDGSDLYQRTFEVTGLVNKQWNNSALGTSGINIVDAPSGTIHWLYNNVPDIITNLNYYRSETEFSTTYINATAADVNILPYIGDSGYTVDKAVITIKYTKPSVQALNANLIPSDNPFNVSVMESSETPTSNEEPTDEMR